MPGNSFGQLFSITTFGESHGAAVGVVVDGCPPGLKLSEKDIQPDLDRRKPGQSKITTPRKEADTIHILSGVFQGKTTGTPILLIAFNKDAKSSDYEAMKDIYRPSHADYTYDLKYGLRDWRGSGRASARETLARVAAGAIAKKYLFEKFGTECISFVEQVGDIKTGIELSKVTPQAIEKSIVRCPDKAIADKMIKLIEKVKSDGDSIGGVVKGLIKNPPPGIGEPVFDKLPADLGKAMLSINAVKGFEFGSGFDGVSMRGSEHNDLFTLNKNKIAKSSNNAGGTLGGISTGEDIYFRVAFKPVATISKSQKTVTRTSKHATLAAEGRHDPCVLPRAVPIVDAMSALVIMDHYLRHKAQNL
ncbi:MAG TPA: chorismate synthase [Bacteroidia bacterium]|jgi:chorismate synthase|nr:chorismate synthase [Bacteroidia bacterium]